MSALSQEEIGKYWEIFQAQKPQNGSLNEQQVVTLLRKSQLPDDKLNHIWSLSDIDGDSRMDFEEFCVAMRLVFDHLKAPQDPLPSQLPQWLVPPNKQHLLDAKLALAGMAPLALNSASSDDEEMNLRQDFNWYIAPGERREYEQIYTVNCDRRGGVGFEDLRELYGMLSNVPSTDVSSAWNLVNPKSDEKIDKEQCIVFLHILNQRHKGVKLPRSVPASLRATFGKEMLNYDLDGPQAEIKKPLEPERKSQGLSGYLSKLGLSGQPADSSSQSQPGRGSADAASGQQDLLTGGDSDWEEVRLRRELADLDARLQKIEAAKQQSQQRGSSAAAVVRRELEAMLEYKQTLLARPEATSALKDAQATREEVDMIAEQLDALREHFQSRQSELQALRAQLAQG